MGQYPVSTSDACIDHFNNIPQHLPPLPCECEIIEVWSGSEYTIVADNYGKLWSCGWNEHGNLGTGSYVSMSTWTKVMKGNDFNINSCNINDVDTQIKLNVVWEGSLACGGGHVICMK
jgi:alpha-tubulin suppressor-like RCC1 family protein